MRQPKTKIVTFLSYENVLSEIEKNGLTIPISYLDNPQNIDDLISSIIEEFEPIEAISYSSFLNAVAQTYHANESISIGMREIKTSRLNTNPPDGMFFHRDNLLYFIAQIINITDSTGKKKITGSGNLANTQDYYKTLLLISTKLNKSQDNPEHAILKDIFIKTYPYYYLPEITYTIYSIKIQRYWYIYHDLLNNLEEKRKSTIIDGIKSIGQYICVSFDEYFQIINSIFNWFINVPLKRTKNPDDNNIKKLGFNYRHLGTFYICKKNFPGDNKLIKLIEKMSIDYAGLKQLFSVEKRKDEIVGFYKDIQNFFDHPLYKISNDTFCIIDLKFLFEGICGGFIWHLNKITEKNIQNLKEQYGYLIEEYFSFIIKELFKGVESTHREDSKPDAVLETDEAIIIFEFTTEYYRFASLYNTGIKKFLEDLYRLLFNDGRHDPLARGKQEKGKFHKLNNYIDKIKSGGKKIIPILVTENNLGDYDLLDRFDNFLTNKGNEKKLNNLKIAKPLIINLEDLELCWAFCDPQNAGSDFVRYVNNWDKAKEEKGRYHYNFSYFISSQNDGIVKNQRYKEFFNYTQFLGKIK